MVTQIFIFFEITNAKMQNVNAMDNISYEPLACYVFDRGYCDLAYFFRIHQINFFGQKPSSQIKAFVFQISHRFCKWIKTARQHVLNIYKDSNVYIDIFKFEFGKQARHHWNIA